MIQCKVWSGSLHTRSPRQSVGSVLLADVTTFTLIGRIILPRKIIYFSPTSLSAYLGDKDAFYLSYIADKRPPRIPQTLPMSIGSSFDAYVKSALYDKLKLGTDKAYTFDALFEAQVEKHNREWAKKHGAFALECYKKCGAYGDLLNSLVKAVGKPRFEFDVTGIVNGYIGSDQQGVMLKGKPDVFYINEKGIKVILDFKVNGYCSNSAVSPMPGYVRLRSPGDPQSKQHKDAFIMHGINVGTYLENLNEDWARQLSFYAWLCGCNVGEEFHVAIDQLACGPGGEYPMIRVAEHRLRISPEFQQATFTQAYEAMQVANSDHFFRDLSIEESKARCRMLDGMAESLAGEGTSDDAWFGKVTRGT